MRGISSKAVRVTPDQMRRLVSLASKHKRSAPRVTLIDAYTTIETIETRTYTFSFEYLIGSDLPVRCQRHMAGVDAREYVIA